MELADKEPVELPPTATEGTRSGEGLQGRLLGITLPITEVAQCEAAAEAAQEEDQF